MHKIHKLMETPNPNSLQNLFLLIIYTLRSRLLYISLYDNLRLDMQSICCCIYDVLSTKNITLVFTKNMLLIKTLMYPKYFVLLSLLIFMTLLIIVLFVFNNRFV